jgi:hypothetical protein
VGKRGAREEIRETQTMEGWIEGRAFMAVA